MLAAHLEPTLPAEILADTPELPMASLAPAAVATPSGANIRPTDTPLERAVADQARTIDRLVALLEKGSMSYLNAPGPAVNGTSSAIALPTSASHVPATPVSAPIEVESTVPQRGIYASSRLSERLSASYNESVTLRFKGVISIEKMTRAVELLVERHDALRGSFDETGLVMKITPAVKCEMPLTDLSSIEDCSQRAERLRKLITDETSSPFPLPFGPLFRCQMVLSWARSRGGYFHGTPHHL